MRKISHLPVPFGCLIGSANTVRCVFLSCSSEALVQRLGQKDRFFTGSLSLILSSTSLYLVIVSNYVNMCNRCHSTYVAQSDINVCVWNLETKLQSFSASHLVSLRGTNCLKFKFKIKLWRSQTTDVSVNPGHFLSVHVAWLSSIPTKIAYVYVCVLLRVVEMNLLIAWINF